jgi:hypothetical protein
MDPEAPATGQRELVFCATGGRVVSEVRGRQRLAAPPRRWYALSRWARGRRGSLGLRQGWWLAFQFLALGTVALWSAEAVPGAKAYVYRSTRGVVQVTIFVPPCEKPGCTWQTYFGAVDEGSIIGHGDVGPKGVAKTISVPVWLEGRREVYLLVSDGMGFQRSVVYASLPTESDPRSEWYRGILTLLSGTGIGALLSFLSGYYLPRIMEKRQALSKAAMDRNKLYSHIETAIERMLCSSRGAEFRYELPLILSAGMIEEYLCCVEDREKLFSWLGTLERARRCFGDDSRTVADWDKEEGRLKAILAEMRTKIVSQGWFWLRKSGRL